MNKSFLFAAIATALATSACGGGNPCADYVAAVEDCYGADLPAAGFDEATLCANTKGVAASYYTCLADAYDGGDCSTAEGVGEIGTALAGCTP